MAFDIFRREYIRPVAIAGFRVIGVQDARSLHVVPEYNQAYPATLSG
jgi:hypothetical protein